MDFFDSNGSSKKIQIISLIILSSAASFFLNVIWTQKEVFSSLVTKANTSTIITMQNLFYVRQLLAPLRNRGVTKELAVSFGGEVTMDIPISVTRLKKLLFIRLWCN